MHRRRHKTVFSNYYLSRDVQNLTSLAMRKPLSWSMTSLMFIVMDQEACAQSLIAPSHLYLYSWPPCTHHHQGLTILKTLLTTPQRIKPVSYLEFGRPWITAKRVIYRCTTRDEKWSIVMSLLVQTNSLFNNRKSSSLLFSWTMRITFGCVATNKSI